MRTRKGGHARQRAATASGQFVLRLPPALEPAFCGAEDLTPSNFYNGGDAEDARRGARFVVRTVRPHVQ